jgi:Domain of unknown function DUF29
MSEHDYDTDFCAWLEAQAGYLRVKDWSALDLEHLIEEIEGMAKQQQHAIRSHLRVLLQHLLKWRYEPDHQGPSWRSSITNARVEIELYLEENHSLQRLLPAFLAWAYPRARRLAADDTGLPLATFPTMCEWSLDDVLDQEFWPPADPGHASSSG